MVIFFICMHTQHIHICTCAHTHILVNTYTHMNHMHACTHTHACACTHTHTHTHIHTQKTHTHIHTQKQHTYTHKTHTQLYGVPVTRGHEAWQTDCELWWCLAQASRQSISKLADYTEQADSDTKQEIAELRAEVERKKAHAKYVEDKYRRLKVRPHPLCCSSAHWLLVLRHLVLRGLDVLMNGNGGEGGGERRERVCVYVCECMCAGVCVWEVKRERGEREGERLQERERHRVFGKSEGLLKEKKRTESAWKDWKCIKRGRGRESDFGKRERLLKEKEYKRGTQRVLGKIKSLLKERIEICKCMWMLNDHHDLHSSQCYLKWCGFATSRAQHNQWDIIRF